MIVINLSHEELDRLVQELPSNTIKSRFLVKRIVKLVT